VRAVQDVSDKVERGDSAVAEIIETMPGRAENEAVLKRVRTENQVRTWRLKRPKWAIWCEKRPKWAIGLVDYKWPPS
jgi:hypothetical protein